MNVTTQQWLKRLPSWMFKAGAQAWLDYQFPRHLFIETTSACNLSCGYCPREQRQQHMDYGLFQRVVEEATRYGPRSFSLHLFGEPMLYPHWRDAIAFIKRCHRHHTVLLTTNGTALNANIDKLLAANPDQVFWTWRPEAVFTPVTKEKLRRWGKFRVRFIKEITPPEAYEEWKDWKNVEGRKMHNYGGQIDITTIKTVASAKIVGSNGQMLRSMRWPCYHLWLAPAVAWNGDILLCCADPHHKEVLGHFPEQSVHEVWTGDRLKAIREGHLQGEYKGICAHCDVWKQYPDIFFKWQKCSQ